MGLNASFGQVPSVCSFLRQGEGVYMVGAPGLFGSLESLGASFS